MGELVFDLESFEELLDVGHDQGELFVAIHYCDLAILVPVEVDLAVSITIKTHALQAGVLRLVPTSGQLFVLEVISPALIVEVRGKLVVVEKSYLQMLLEALQRYHLLHDMGSHSVCAIEQKLALVVLFTLGHWIFSAKSDEVCKLGFEVLRVEVPVLRVGQVLRD